MILPCTYYPTCTPLLCTIMSARLFQAGCSSQQLVQLVTLQPQVVDETDLRSSHAQSSRGMVMHGLFSRLVVCTAAHMANLLGEWSCLACCSKPLPKLRLKWVCHGVQHEKFQSAPGSRVGTPAYLAPEVILTTKGKTYDGKVMPCTASMLAR